LDIFNFMIDKSYFSCYMTRRIVLDKTPQNEEIEHPKKTPHITHYLPHN
jgi:hypothetical protein